jgi:hypothetical protein
MTFLRKTRKTRKTRKYKRKNRRSTFRGGLKVISGDEGAKAELAKIKKLQMVDKYFDKLMGEGGVETSSSTGGGGATDYLPQSNETDQNYINRASGEIKTNLQNIQKSKGFDHPDNQQSVGIANKYAQHLQTAANIIANDPQTKDILGSVKTEKFQDLGNKILEHTNNLQQSIANGDPDNKVKSSLAKATKTAINMYKIANDKDVQNHLMNTGSSLYQMGKNLAKVGTKYYTGTLTTGDAIGAVGSNVSLGTSALYHGTSAIAAARKATNA